MIFLYIFRKVDFSKPLFLEIDLSEFSFLRVLNLVFVTITFITFFTYIGDIYTGYDAIVSYNGRWANSWYENRIPTNSNLYPHLLTTNMSLSNVLIGLSPAKMQFFSYILCLSFIPITSLVAGPLAKQLNDNRIYLANIVFLSLINFPLYQKIISNNGYMDIPVACLSIISIGLFALGWAYTKNENKNNYGIKLIFMAAAIAAGAAATKQSGLMIAFVSFPAVIYWAYYFKISILKTIFNLFLIHFVIYGLWYVQSIYQIYTGISASEFNIVQSQFSKLDGYFARIQRAFSIWPEFYYLSIVGIFAIGFTGYRWVAIMMLLGLSIWSLFFSFDYRNLLPTFPYIAISIASVMYFIYGKMNFIYKKEKIKINKTNLKINGRLLILLIMAISIVTILIISPSDKKLYEQNEYQRRLIMPIRYSEAIYNAWDNHGVGRIITSQKYYIARLPRMFRKVVEPFDFELDTYENNDYFELLVNSSNADYILISNHSYFKPNEIVRSKIGNLLNNNLIKLVAEQDDVMVYKINK